MEMGVVVVVPTMGKPVREAFLSCSAAPTLTHLSTKRTWWSRRFPPPSPPPLPPPPPAAAMVPRMSQQRLAPLLLPVKAAVKAPPSFMVTEHSNSSAP